MGKGPNSKQLLLLAGARIRETTLFTGIHSISCAV